MKLTDALLAKFGHTIQIAGAIYVGDGQIYFAPFPEETANEVLAWHSHVLELDRADWEKLIAQTDQLLVEVLAKSSDGSLAKVVIRKCERNVEQSISWTVYRRDNYTCRYCAADEVPLTVDHLVTWEEGGPSIVANLVTACKACNRKRGTTPYAEWLKHPYYREKSKRLSLINREKNDALVATLDAIPRRVHVKSR